MTHSRPRLPIQYLLLVCKVQHLIQATSLVNKRYRLGSDAASLALLSHESHRGDAQLLPDSFCISPHDHDDPSAYATYLRVCAPYEHQGLRCSCSSQWRVGAGSRSGEATMDGLLLACGCHHQVRLVGLISGMSKMATTPSRLWIWIRGFNRHPIPLSTFLSHARTQKAETEGGACGLCRFPEPAVAGDIHAPSLVLCLSFTCILHAIPKLRHTTINCSLEIFIFAVSATHFFFSSALEGSQPC
ncbi:hypothetical protein GGI42DRAFT_306431 [Trichoderma sp. SZMC 28013]